MPASLPSALLTVRLRQLSEKEYLEVLVQERLTAPLLPVNTHWIPSLVTAGTGSFTMVKEMVTGSPMLIDLLLTPSEGATLGGTAERSNIYETATYVYSHIYYTCASVQFIHILQILQI